MWGQTSKARPPTSWAPIKSGFAALIAWWLRWERQDQKKSRLNLPFLLATLKCCKFHKYQMPNTKCLNLRIVNQAQLYNSPCTYSPPSKDSVQVHSNHTWRVYLKPTYLKRFVWLGIARFWGAGDWMVSCKLLRYFPFLSEDPKTCPTIPKMSNFGSALFIKALSTSSWRKE